MQTRSASKGNECRRRWIQLNEAIAILEKVAKCWMKLRKLKLEVCVLQSL